MEKEIEQIKKDLIALKAQNRTVGDSATAYQKTLALGSNPTDSSNNMYRWDIYLEPLANQENAIFSPNLETGYYVWHWGGGYSTVYVDNSFSQSMIDVNDPNHIVVFLTYYNPSEITYYGTNILVITANVPFEIKSSTKTTVVVPSGY